MPCTTDEKFRLLGGEGCGGEGDSEQGQRKGYHGGEGVRGFGGSRRDISCIADGGLLIDGLDLDHRVKSFHGSHSIIKESP